MMSARHFLSLMDCTPEELVSVIRRGIELKDLRNRGVLFEPLKNRVLGMIFEKSSTRTRLSFEAGMIQLGGQAIFLSPRDTQLGRGEPIEDSVRGGRARLAGGEELLGLGHRHREDLGDVPAAERVLEHRGLEPLPLALLAG